MRQLIVFLGFVIAFGSFAALAESPKTLPMPPTFNTRIDADEALTKYPLGVITKVAAFAHRGQENRTVTPAEWLRGQGVSGRERHGPAHVHAGVQ